MFSCQEIKAFVDSFVDEEFDAQEYAELELHLSHCKECRELVEYRLQLKRLIAKTLKTEAPESLKMSIFAALDQESPSPTLSNHAHHDEPTPDSSELIPVRDTSVNDNVCRVSPLSIIPLNGSSSLPPVSKPKRLLQKFYSSGFRKTAALLASAAAILLFVAFVPQWTVAPATTENLSIWEESVDWYRSDFPMEVHGPNLRTITDWFQGKVNFDVQPLSFGSSSDGVNAHLVGGRLASIFNRRAALLEYIVNGSVVTVLVFDGEGLTVPADKLRTFDNQKIAVVEGPGYDVALFHRNDLTYTITTDLPTARFNQLIRQVLKSNK